MDIHFRVWHYPEKKMYYRGYQKLMHVLLYENESGEAKRAKYEDCEFMQSTTLFDKAGIEIFEGDRVKAFYQGREFTGMVDTIPDMYKSRKLHPMQSLLDNAGINPEAEDLVFEVLGHKYELK